MKQPIAFLPAINTLESRVHTRMKPANVKAYTFYEFFCGAGMARIGMGPTWSCVFANDIDKKKCATYRANFGGAPELVEGDVGEIGQESLSEPIDLAWASFPCQDLSLAGTGAGLSGKRSGVFWDFWNLVRAKRTAKAGPRLVVLENVEGFLSSGGGKDFHAVLEALLREGYRFGALVINAAHFVPQSRPRVFVVAMAAEYCLPDDLHSYFPIDSPFINRRLIAAYERLPVFLKERWVWWTIPSPSEIPARIEDVVEPDEMISNWHSEIETSKLLSLMSPTHRQRVEQKMRSGTRHIGTVYRRTRRTREGKKVQRAEVRFDGVAGALRTPAGGSSRQTIVVVDNCHIRSRLITPREAARLMGIPEWYRLPENYNETYHLLGDGVVVDAVKWLSDHLLTPIAAQTSEHREGIPLYVKQPADHSLSTVG